MYMTYLEILKNGEINFDQIKNQEIKDFAIKKKIPLNTKFKVGNLMSLPHIFDSLCHYENTSFSYKLYYFNSQVNFAYN